MHNKSGSYLKWFWFDSIPLLSVLMAPWGSNSCCSATLQTCIAKVAVEVTNFSHRFILEEDHVTMPALEEEFRLVRAYKEYEEV
jgi:hypothetical protein